MYDLSLAECRTGAFRSSRGETHLYQFVGTKIFFKSTVNDPVYGILQCFSNLFFSRTTFITQNM